MIAVDTNVLVRLLVTGDDPDQSARASELFASNVVHISVSVLLETAWVLRRSFGFDRRQIARAFGLLLGLSNVRVERANQVFGTLRWIDGGLDIADALHLLATPPGSSFVTFDRILAHRAARLVDTPAVQFA